MKIVNRKINELIAAEYNPRKLSPEQFEQIKSSLQRFGFVDPVIINKHKDRKDIIVGGHQRVKVAKEIGMEQVPTVEVNLDEARERELNVRLNKNTGDWDFDILRDEFGQADLIEWGFDEGELLNDDIDNIADGEEVLLDQAIQLNPQREYIVIMCADDDGEEFDKLKELLKIKRVRRGGYKKGSAFDSIGFDRVVLAKKLIDLIGDENE